MNLYTIRSLLEAEINKQHDFLYVGMRGMSESFSGRIIKVYSRTFLILTDDGVSKSFSYSDFLIHSLKIVG